MNHAASITTGAVTASCPWVAQHFDTVAMVRAVGVSGVDPNVGICQQHEPSDAWISHGPRANDASFDLRPDDWLLVEINDEPPYRARVTHRDGNRVWTQLALGSLVDTSTSDASNRR